MKVILARDEAHPQEPVLAAPFQEWCIDPPAVWTAFYKLDDAYLLRFPGLADFEISRNGASVLARPVPGTSAATVEHLYLNQVLPLALSRQGQLVLHASCVAIEDRGVAFMGMSGRGKSTLAAAFAANGAKLLTDDGLQLTWKDSRCWVEPSHPSIRLWGDSHAALIPHTVQQAPALEFTRKSRLLAGPELPFSEHPQPLLRIFVLGEGAVEEVTIDTIKPADALIELAKHSFLLDLDERAALAWHFDELQRLTAAALVYRLDYPRRYAALPAVCEAVRQHLDAPNP